MTSDVTTDPSTLLSVSGSASPSAGLAVGDTTTFTAVVTNIGARTVSGVTLTNGLTGIGPRPARRSRAARSPPRTR